MVITIVKSKLNDPKFNGESRPRYRVYDHEITSVDQVDKNSRVEFSWASACSAAVRMAIGKEVMIKVFETDTEIADPDSIVNRNK